MVKECAPRTDNVLIIDRFFYLMTEIMWTCHDHQINQWVSLFHGLYVQIHNIMPPYFAKVTDPFFVYFANLILTTELMLNVPVNSDSPRMVKKKRIPRCS